LTLLERGFNNSCEKGRQLWQQATAGVIEAAAAAAAVEAAPASAWKKPAASLVRVQHCILKDVSISSSRKLKKGFFFFFFSFSLFLCPYSPC
jgi:hypothetical protein